MNPLLRWLLTVTAVTSFTGCPGFGDQTLAEIEGIDETVTYEGEIATLIERRCLVCHRDPPVAGAPNSLATYEDAARFAPRMKARAVDEGTMPPGAPLPDDERALIAAWVAAGAPRGTPMPDMAMPDSGPDRDLGPDMEPADLGPDTDLGPDPDLGPPPTWNDDIAPLIVQNCAIQVCHGGATPFGDLDLSTYAGFERGGFSGDLTGGGDPADSLLIDRLRARDGFPVMPQGGPMLPDATIRTFEAWIAAGHPEG